MNRLKFERLSVVFRSVLTKQVRADIDEGDWDELLQKGLAVTSELALQRVQEVGSLITFGPETCWPETCQELGIEPSLASVQAYLEITS